MDSFVVPPTALSDYNDYIGYNAYNAKHNGGEGVLVGLRGFKPLGGQ